MLHLLFPQTSRVSAKVNTPKRLLFTILDERTPIGSIPATTYVEFTSIVISFVLPRLILGKEKEERVGPIDL